MTLAWRRRGHRASAVALLFCAALPGLAAQPAAEASFDARIAIASDRPGPTIDPNIYGQFVEHLGRGVYEESG